jgi:hypothetical protein
MSSVQTREALSDLTNQLSSALHLTDSKISGCDSDCSVPENVQKVLMEDAEHVLKESKRSADSPRTSEIRDDKIDSSEQMKVDADENDPVLGDEAGLWTSHPPSGKLYIGSAQS